MANATGSALPRLEAFESRVLLSAYSIMPIGYVGTNATGANSESMLAADATGNLYGTTMKGGAFGEGTVFEIGKGSSAITTLASFNGSNGKNVVAGVTLDASGNIFGTTGNGGTNDAGTVYEIAKGSRSITTLASFHEYDGSLPLGALTLDGSGNLYGTTEAGDPTNGSNGTLFEIPKGSNTFTTLAAFTVSGAQNPVGTLTLDPSGNLYGVCNNSGVFECAAGTNAITKIASFPSTIAGAVGGLALDASGNLYGETSGGTINVGTVYEVAAGSNACTAIASFNTANGATPEGGLTIDASGNLYGTTSAGGANGQGTLFEVGRGTNTITTLATFSGANGADPQAGVMRDSSGNIYGTAYSAGANGNGTVFVVGNGSSTITTVASFDAIGTTFTGMTVDAAGNVFGTTGQGGTMNDGTVFEIAKGSTTLTTLASFNGTNGRGPSYGLTLDASGNLFDTTLFGGASNYGTFFEIAKGSTTITTLASLTSSNGQEPTTGAMLDLNGNLYSTSEYGGAYGNGTLFKLAKGSNTITTLASFTARNGGSGFTQAYATGNLVTDLSGNIFGTTSFGSRNATGTLFELPAGSNTITTVATFSDIGSEPLTTDSAGNVYGTEPSSGYASTTYELAHGTNTITVLATLTNGFGVAMADPAGNLYGTAAYGDTGNSATIAEIPKGSSTTTTLASFTGFSGGLYGRDAAGNFYGYSSSGGPTGNGLIFEALSNPVPTVTLSVANGPDPSFSTQTLTFTASVSGGVPDGETVTLADTSNNNATVATGTLSGGSATLTIPASTLSVGTHKLVAVYGGDANLAASQSAAYTQTVQAAPPPPALSGAPVINGDDPNGLYTAAGQSAPGTQRSMVEDIVYTFNEPVTITNTNLAFTLAVAGPAGGTLPTTLYAQAVAGSNGTQWAVSLTGQPEGTIASIANGEYSITINPAYVFAAADGTTSMSAGTGRTDQFYRLYGDVFGTENVTALDYNRFKNSLTTYNPMFDNYNTGNITALDYNLFKKDLSINYAGDGFVTSI